MTVEDCVKTIKEVAGEQLFTKTQISSLAGRKIGIDFGLVARRLMVKPHEWNIDRFDVVQREFKEIRPQIMRDFIPRLVKFVSLFLSSGVDVVGYFDGEEKMNKIAYFERQEEFKKRDEKVKILRERLLMIHPAQLTVEVCRPLRDLLKQQHYIQKDEMEYVINLLSALGIECYRSKNEAERLGSFHAIEGHIFALLSDDSDCFAHGCPIILRRPPKSQKEDDQEWNESVFDMVIMDQVLKSLDMPYDLFLEFCICLGTDFSKRTYRKGPVAVMKELRKVGCIERLQRNPEDMKRYFHLSCRGHFRYRNSKEVVESQIPGVFNPDAIRDLLTTYDLLNKYEEFVSIGNRRVPGVGYQDIRLPIGFGAYNLPSSDDPIDYSYLQPKSQPTQMVHQSQPNLLQSLQTSFASLNIQPKQLIQPNLQVPPSSSIKIQIKQPNQSSLQAPSSSVINVRIGQPIQQPLTKDSSNQLSNIQSKQPIQQLPDSSIRNLSIQTSNLPSNIQTKQPIQPVLNPSVQTLNPSSVIKLTIQVPKNSATNVKQQEKNIGNVIQPSPQRSNNESVELLNQMISNLNLPIINNS